MISTNNSDIGENFKNIAIIYLVLFVSWDNLYFLIFIISAINNIY